MILYKTITFGDGQKVEFGVPNTDSEIEKMFGLRFRVYVKEKKYVADSDDPMADADKRDKNRNCAYSFIKPNEQHELLRSAGFSNISENRFVYAGQVILNFAIKFSGS